MKANIVTYTGKVFDLLNPKPEMVCIEDIAYSLAYQCRYTGHTRSFYSVAQHCVLMAENEDLPGDPMVKLLHDADEAYIGDIAKPWKRLLRVGGSSRIEPVGDFEWRIQEIVGLALGIDLSYSAEVKEADLRMIATEVRDLMPRMEPSFEWGCGGAIPVRQTIVGWHPAYAETQFLATYKRLTK